MDKKTLPPAVNYVLVAILLSHSSWVSQAAFTDGSTMLYKDKKISFLGDYHKIGTKESTKAQTLRFFDILQTLAQASPIHIFLEQAAHYVNSTESLCLLKGLVSEANPRGLSLEDTEVRRRSITAEHILKNEYPKYFLKEEDYCFNDSLALGELSFQSIDDEYHELINSAELFKKQNPTLNFRRYDQKLDSAKDEYDDFLKMRSLLAIKPGDLVLNQARILWGSNQRARIEMARLTDRAFCELVELYLFKRIYEYPGKHIALVIGGSHITCINTMLREQGAETSLEYYCGKDKDDKPIFLSDNQMHALLTGYSLVYIVKEQLINGYIRFCLFISSVESCFRSPEEPPHQ